MMKQIVKSGEVPGILAYYQNSAAGWCSVAPREKFQALERSRILKRLDDKPVWSVVCFFIKKEYRKKGFTTELIKFIIKYCKDQGGQVIEAYPVDPKKPEMPLHLLRRKKDLYDFTRTLAKKPCCPH